MSATDLGDRYGTAPSPVRWVLLGVVALVVLGFAVLMGWIIVGQSQPSAASGELTFRVIDNNTAEATFNVDLSDEDVEATCRLRAYAEDHVLVGEVAFTPDGSGRVTREIATDRRATSVELVGCTAPGQPRPR